MSDLFSRNWAFIDAQLQLELARTSLLIAGTGLGSVIAELAARTGFGRIVLADGDVVEPSNLNRQAFTHDDVGRNKAAVCSERLLRIVHTLDVEAVDEFLTPANAAGHVAGADIVVNTVDFDAGVFFHLNRIARDAGKPSLFPVNLGWGSAVLVFTPASEALEDMLDLDPRDLPPPREVLRRLMARLSEAGVPTYLVPVSRGFFGGSDWPNDPQLGCAAALSASLVVCSAVQIVAGATLPTAPRAVWIDLLESLASRDGLRVDLLSRGVDPLPQ
jgi:molybdopterin/thiamine biosynthesis adenylyltransferase